MLPLVLLVAACGENGSPCNYTESADQTNGTTAEMTGLTHGEVCGTFSANPYDAPLQSADDDRYRITVTDSTPVLVDVSVGSGLEVLAGVTVRVYDMAGTIMAQARPAFSDHGAFSILLAPGDYDFMISADATGAIDGTIDYRVRFQQMPACDAATGDASYNESTASNGTVNVDFSKDPSFTMDQSSTPDVTGLSVSPGDHESIAGTLDTTEQTDQYADRDTYEITTGGDTNELAIRLDWDGAADVDYILFEADTMLPVIAANASSDTGPEVQMFAVKPNT
ncbi:MAG TPA: hypothetical protein VGC41_08065, partial [Kofleriaceae bacterium]